MRELYSNLVWTWGRYSGHVLNNIGGVYQTLKSADEEGYVFNPVPAETQKASMKFLIGHVFTTPEWLINENILRRIEPSGEIKRISDIQESQLNNLLQKDRLVRIIETGSNPGIQTYSLIKMMDDLRMGIWDDLNKNYSADSYSRNFQIAWINKLSGLLSEQQGDDKLDSFYADINAVALHELEYVKDILQTKKDRIKDPLSRYHFLFCLKRIEDILDADKSSMN